MRKIEMQSKIKNYILIVIIGLLVAVSGYFTYLKIKTKELPKNLIASSGRIDGDLILLNTKYPARVADIFVNEADKVTKGQIIAKLTSKEFLSKYKGLESAINSAKNEKLAFEKTIESSKIELELLKETLPKSIKIKENNLESYKKQLKDISLKVQTAKLNFEQRKRDYERYKKLYQQNSIPKEQFEKIELAYKVAKKEYQSLKVKKDELLNGVNIAKNLLQIEKANLKKIDILEKQIQASTIKLKSIKDKIAQLQANKEEVKAMIDELTIKSPINGYVIEKVANVGEVINSSTPIVSISNPDSYYLKIFVDTINNGKIKLGDKAEIFLDAYPNKPIQAKVIRIAQRAEFTPKEVSVRSDRIQRVYEVRLKPLKYNPILKLGIPAIGIITIDGKGLPNSLDEIPEI